MHLGWRGLYIGQAIAVGVSILVMANVLPTRHPPPGARYRRLVGSLWSLFAAFPELRGRGMMQAFLFGALDGCPPKLEAFHLGRIQMATFGLIGGLGLLVAPIAGRAADRGHGRLIA